MGAQEAIGQFPESKDRQTDIRKSNIAGQTLASQPQYRFDGLGHRIPKLGGSEFAF
jgi:hypothetical protein